VVTVGVIDRCVLGLFGSWQRKKLAGIGVDAGDRGRAESSPW
jgi:hypothetical protein